MMDREELEPLIIDALEEYNLDPSKVIGELLRELSQEWKSSEMEILEGVLENLSE